MDTLSAQNQHKRDFVHEKCVLAASYSVLVDKYLIQIKATNLPGIEFSTASPIEQLK